MISGETDPTTYSNRKKSWGWLKWTKKYRALFEIQDPEYDGLLFQVL